MTSKIKIRIGQIEIEYEGSEEFLKEELPDLLKAVTALHKEAGGSLPTNVPESDSAASSKTAAAFDGSNLGTTNSIAAKLSAKTGSELAIAAAARLVLGTGLEQFNRKQLLQEMQNATQYYKSSYGSNLSKTIRTLVGDHRFIERAKDTYALKADMLKTLESQLA
ncbi:hypothetical protein [Salinicola halimionae]|uniref:hypothetical protein n=1 Tax=Salinicola halimionae TaxID=1949081 RepID=UPI00130036E9|nr:hypothetical protein [Salinicola halimionae]